MNTQLTALTTTPHRLAHLPTPSNLAPRTCKPPPPRPLPIHTLASPPAYPPIILTPSTNTPPPPPLPPRTQAVEIRKLQDQLLTVQKRTFPALAQHSGWTPPDQVAPGASRPGSRPGSQQQGTGSRPGSQQQGTGSRPGSRPGLPRPASQAAGGVGGGLAGSSRPGSQAGPRGSSAVSSRSAGSR